MQTGSPLIVDRTIRRRLGGIRVGHAKFACPLSSSIATARADTATFASETSLFGWAFSVATLGISPHIVEFHRANVMQKLGAKNTADFVRRVLAEE